MSKLVIVLFLLTVSIFLNFDRASGSTLENYVNYEQETNKNDILEKENLYLRLKPKEQKKFKRGIDQFSNMIKCAIGCEPSSYHAYGCYCGFQGSGTPVDGIDSCCMQHDQCYEATKCSIIKQYLISYSWKCKDGKPFCDANQGKWINEETEMCARRLCACDIEFAMCLSKYPCPKAKPYCTSSEIRFLYNFFLQ